MGVVSPGYQRSNRGLSVPSSVLVRVCRSRWAPLLGPLHLLPLGEAFADESVDGALRNSRGDAFAGAVSFSIIDEAPGVIVDIGVWGATEQ